MTHVADVVLIDAARTGDKSALAGLLRRHQDAVYRFGRLMCGSAEDAKDVVQDTMMKVLEKVGDFRGESSFRTWLYAIARSQCSRRYRRGKREVSGALTGATIGQVADPAPSAADQLASEGDRNIVRQAIEGLPEIYKEVLILRDMEGMTAPEVAQTLGLTVEAVKSRLHRARSRLRDQVVAGRAPPPQPASNRCPNVLEMMSRHLEQDLTGEDCARMQRHLRDCDHCQRVCDELRGLLDVCAMAGAESAPDEVRLAVESVLSGIRAGGLREGASKPDS